MEVKECSYVEIRMDNQIHAYVYSYNKETVEVWYSDTRPVSYTREELVLRVEFFNKILEVWDGLGSKEDS